MVATSASPLYAASKAGVLGLVRSHGLATHSRCPVPVSPVRPHDYLTSLRTKVRMVAACPCLVDTPLVRSHVTRHTSHITHHT